MSTHRSASLYVISLQVHSEYFLHPEMIGQVISHYRIVGEIGRGAMGVVYEAEHTVLGRRVAIKMPNSNHGRFLREARAAASLSHPHIATIYDYGTTNDGQPYIVMEYVEGRTLVDVIRAGRTIPQYLRIIREVAEALAEAHRHNIIHRDIKPANIAVDDRGIVKVLDFGLAKQIGLVQNGPDPEVNSFDTRTREGLLVGTPMYFSPEQARGLALDPRSDIFSLGLVLYECLTGKPAFVGATPMDICAKVIHDNPVPPSQLNSAISAELEHVILKALEKLKEDRYQSAAEFVADLQELELTFSNQGSGRFSFNSTQELPRLDTQIIKPSRKLKRLAFIAAAVVLFAGGIAAWLYFSRFRPAPPTQVEQVRLGIGGNVVEAAISPDGKHVAYINDESGRQSIWLRQITTGFDLQVVAPGPTKYKGISFFPDGEYLSYLKTEGDSADLYQIATLGGPARRLVTKIHTPISFSPDGQQFTFVRYEADAHSTTLVIADANGANERSLATLKEPQRFSHGGFYSSGPAWSPDGTLIAVPAFSVTEKTYREIMLVNVADGSMNTINQGRWHMIEKLVWLADGSGFLMNASDANGMFQIWLVTKGGNKVQRITKDPSSYVGLSATNDSRVVLTIKNERVSTVWIHDGVTNSLEQLASSRYLGTMGIAWTQDAKFVLASNANGNYEIWTMETNGSGRKQVLFNEQSNMEPAVSPDGRYIVYVSFEGRHPHLWRINADGTNPIQLTNGGDEDLPRFTPDGKWIVYHSIERSLYKIRKVSIDGGEPVTLVSDHATQPDVSPDGKLIACFARVADTTAWEIRVVPIDGGSPGSTFPLPATVEPEWPGLRWAPDGTALTYVSTVQGVSNVWRQPLTGGEAKPLTDFKENRIFFFDWSRNERKLVLVRGGDTKDVILVRDFLTAK